MTMKYPFMEEGKKVCPTNTIKTSSGQIIYQNYMCSKTVKAVLTSVKTSMDFKTQNDKKIFKITNCNSG